MTADLLKLQGRDAEDIQVLSAVLQDAIVPVVDMLYRPAQNNFVMVCQRLRRETGGDGKFERIRTALNLQKVTAVQTRNIDLADHDRMLDMLMLGHEQGTLTMIFAGDAKIRLTIGEGWSLILEDFGESWPSGCNPCHDGDSL